jgi:hypothetical protein
VKPRKNHTLILGKIKSNENKNLSFLCSSTTSQVIAFISSFIVGLGDSSLNTQVICLQN